MTEVATINLDTVRAGKLRNSGHLNYGKRGGGTIWRHTTIPRLSAIDRPTLNDEETRRIGAGRLREWSVDGGRAGSLDDAIAALNVPSVLSIGDAIVLSRVPMEFGWLRVIQARLAGSTDAFICDSCVEQARQVVAAKQSARGCSDPSPPPARGRETNSGGTP